MRSTLRTLLLLLCFLPVLSPAFATTYVAMADGHLADETPLIVTGRVLSVSPSPADAPAATDYLLEVTEVHKGTAPGASVIVRVPGAMRPGALSAHIYAAPRYGEGDEALLFLHPGSDGTFRIGQMMLGAFHRVEIGGEAYAVRDLSEARETPHPLTGRSAGAAEAAGETARRFDEFTAWLADRADRTAAGETPPADAVGAEPYRASLPEAARSRIAQRFTLINDPPIRWFEFDTGGAVTWYAFQGGQQGLAGGGFAEFRRALNAWNADPNTPIRHVYGGGTGGNAGFTDPAGDGRNTILFGDPNEEISGAFSCNRGGTIAIGGPRYNTGLLRPFDGRQFYVTLEAEVIMNNGAECYGAQPDGSLTYEEVYGHELGHTLGLGHSCGVQAGLPRCFDNPTLDEALMRATVHADGRGARIGSDDLGGSRTLYRPRGGGGGGGTGPAPPTGLEVELAGLDALLTWQDAAGNEDGYRVYRRRQGGSQELIAELPADSVGYTDVGLLPNTTYTYQVGAFNAQGERRGGQASILTPETEPVTIVSLNLPADARPGDAVPFEVETDGPATAANWTFGGEALSRSSETCDTGRLCTFHVFATPGTYPVRVEVIGDAGQTAVATGSLTVVGDPVSFTEQEAMIQSVIFGPRGNTGTFESNCWTHNASSSPVLVTYTYLPRGAGNPNPESREVGLAPGTSVFLPNVVSYLFDEVSSQGSIALTYRTPDFSMLPGQGELRTMCRSFVNLPGSEASFGQFVGENVAATWTDEPKVVAGVLQNDSFTSTVLAVNVDDTPGSVEVSLTDAAGNEVGTPVTLALGPRTMRFRPVAAVFPEAENRPGPFTARFTSDNVRFLASVTLLESESEDQIFINAREPNADNPLFVPRVARSESQFDAFLISRLTARNDSGSPTELSIELWRRGQANLDPSTVTRTVPARGNLVVDDVIRDLFGEEREVGALRITWTNAEGIAPRIQTYSLNQGQNPGDQTFGMLVDSQPDDSGRTQTVDFGAEQSDLFRADFGILNLGSTPTPVRITLRREDGAALAATEITLRPQQHLERNLAGIFQDTAIGLGTNWTVETDSLNGNRVITYLANINASGDIFFVPGTGRALLDEEPAP